MRWQKLGLLVDVKVKLMPDGARNRSGRFIAPNFIDRPRRTRSPDDEHPLIASEAAKFADPWPAAI